MRYQQITVAVEGNRFGNEYARGGVAGYYSTWTLKLKLDDHSGYLVDYDATLKQCNLDKSDIPQKYFDNHEMFLGIQRG